MQQHHASGVAGGSASRSSQQTDPAGQSFDVVIVGSGASGGWVAKQLTEAGLHVAVLEAGRALTPADYTEHVPAYDLPYRGRTKRPLERERPRQAGSYAVREWNASWYVNDLDEPYVDASDPGFLWVRPRVVGGRTNIWGRGCLRMGDMDFKGRSHDGMGVDWPFGYDELKPWYDMVEAYVGVSAMEEQLPELPDGPFLPAIGLTCAEREVRGRMKDTFGYTLTQGRTANLTRPLHGRQPCHYCGPCEHGCVTRSYFNSAFTTMADAEATGRCTLVTGAMAWKVLTDPETHKATGVLYVDRATRQPREIFGRVVALCAQTFESVRILFNSATRQHPNGLANSSGVLGTYLMTHFAGNGATGELPDVLVQPSTGGPVRPCGTLVPRFRNLPGRPQHKEFVRGYAYTTSVGGGFNMGAAGFGESYKQAIRERRPAYVSFMGFGECLPYETNTCTIDPDVVDAWGIPVMRIRLSPGENERKMHLDMAVAAAEILDGIGAKNIQIRQEMRGQAHEVGAARMGTDPKTSVLNPWLQAHDVPNLFVMDGSCFPSSGWQNNTLTLMALAVRGAEYMKEQMRQGSI